jgi:hypothetical protein
MAVDLDGNVVIPNSSNALGVPLKGPPGRNLTVIALR